MPQQSNKTQWRSRRGTLELDLVLTCFYDAQYSNLDANMRCAYDDLLAEHDNKLQAWLIEGLACDVEALVKIVQLVRISIVDNAK